MNDNGQSMSIVTGLIVGALVLGVVAGLIAFFVNAINEQREGIGNALTGMQSQEYTRWDESEVTGREVMSLLATSKEKGFAVAIVTKRNVPGATSDSDIYDAVASAIVYGTIPGTVDGTYADGYLFEVDDGLTAETTGAAGTYIGTSVGAFKEKTGTGYVNPNARFTTYLIRDDSDAVVGVLAAQNFE